MDWELFLMLATVGGLCFCVGLLLGHSAGKVDPETEPLPETESLPEFVPVGTPVLYAGVETYVARLDLQWGYCPAERDGRVGFLRVPREDLPKAADEHRQLRLRWERATRRQASQGQGRK